MTTNTSAVRPKAPLSPLRIVSSALFLLFAILTTVSAALSIGLYLSNVNVWPQIAVDYPLAQPKVFEAMFLLVSTIVAPLAGLAIVLVGLALRKRWLPSIMGFALFIVVFIVPLIFEVVIYEIIRIESLIPPVLDPQNGELIEKPLGLLNVIVLALALVTSIVASVLTPKTAKEVNQPDLAVTPQSSPAAQIPAAQTTGQSNLTNLPMFALIGAFIIPLAGIILGHLSLNYMKKGQLSTQNKGMATTGLILGYVFVGLGFLTGLILFIVLIVSAASGF
jgi:hypothetical protein